MPAWPLSTTQYAMSFVGPGGACGFFKWPAAVLWQTMQLSKLEIERAAPLAAREHGVCLAALGIAARVAHRLCT
jgi:hypothetical protein